MAITVSCSSNGDNTPGDDPENPSGNSGAPHHYDITVGDQNHSGEIDNIYGTDGENGAIRAVSNFYKENG